MDMNFSVEANPSSPFLIVSICLSDKYFILVYFILNSIYSYNNFFHFI
jgi:hypothetical protein